MTGVNLNMTMAIVCIAYPTSPCMSRGRIGVISEHGFSNFYQTVIAVENIDRVAAIIL